VIPAVNWNETWEKNFEPIRIDERCRIRAPFHDYENVEIDIIIEPKMSFGTGHHETTHLMSSFLLDMDLQNKKTLDMGCGTSILAILAAKKGAMPVDAIDIDPWCVENSMENIERNDCSLIRVLEGVAENIPARDYDVIIANINRNILLEDMERYANAMKAGGVLLLSGFYEHDIEDISKKCVDLGFNFLEKRLRNQWASLKFEKK
ncbi:50S ribosomal protein L11 methyltransferase, partial [Arthrospira platensis SPKY1]|nr:50S ribosomal protein L11 methyltransferase [Arthrospira platensis SPKY1]